MNTQKCPRCGHQASAATGFCGACGARLDGTPRTLRRRRADAKLAGVCSGLAGYFDTDPTLVRVAYLSAAILSGFVPGAILYVVLAMFIPGD